MKNANNTGAKTPNQLTPPKLTFIPKSIILNNIPR